MAAVPRTSKTWGGKVFVSTVKATFGLAFSAETFGACGTVHSTNSAPFQWKPIGIARGNPSGPTYANRAGIFDCINSCANGSLSTRATSCCCIITSSRRYSMRQAYEVGFSIPVDSKNKGAWPPVKLRRITAMPFLVTGEKDKKFKLHFLTGFLIRQRSPSLDVLSSSDKVHSLDFY